MPNLKKAISTDFISISKIFWFRNETSRTNCCATNFKKWWMRNDTEDSGIEKHITDIYYSDSWRMQHCYCGFGTNHLGFQQCLLSTFLFWLWVTYNSKRINKRRELFEVLTRETQGLHIGHCASLMSVLFGEKGSLWCANNPRFLSLRNSHWDY